MPVHLGWLLPLPLCPHSPRICSAPSLPSPWIIPLLVLPHLVQSQQQVEEGLHWRGRHGLRMGGGRGEVTSQYQRPGPVLPRAHGGTALQFHHLYVSLPTRFPPPLLPGPLPIPYLCDGVPRHVNRLLWHPMPGLGLYRLGTRPRLGLPASLPISRGAHALAGGATATADSVAGRGPPCGSELQGAVEQRLVLGVH